MNDKILDLENLLFGTGDTSVVFTDDDDKLSFAQVIDTMSRSQNQPVGDDGPSAPLTERVSVFEFNGSLVKDDPKYFLNITCGRPGISNKHLTCQG